MTAGNASLIAEARTAAPNTSISRLVHGVDEADGERYTSLIIDDTAGLDLMTRLANALEQTESRLIAHGECVPADALRDAEQHFRADQIRRDAELLDTAEAEAEEEAAKWFATAEQGDYYLAKDRAYGFRAAADRLRAQGGGEE